MPDLLNNTASVRLVRARYGFIAYNSLDFVVGRSVEVYGEYYESEVQIFRQLLRPGDVVVDVGANIGTHTVAMARLVGPSGTVVAFEPQTVIHQLLSANVALNSLTNVHALHAAAGERAGEIFAPDMNYARPGNFGGVELGGTQGKAVPTMPLDEVAACQGARLIKIDVEGMEGAVLAGAEKLLRSQRPVLYVENDRVKHSPDLIDRLRAFDYRVFWHFAPFFNPKNFAQHHQSIFPVGYCRNERGVYLNGLATNLICMPAERDTKVKGFIEVGDRLEHPCKPEYRDRLTPGVPVLDWPRRPGRPSLP
ncbi:MAG: FkbM family methyltransferase [Rhizomicrobium sp.]